MREVPQAEIRRSILDRAILAVAPGWGLRREAARAQLGLLSSIQNSHRGGISTRISGEWGKSTSFRIGSTAGYSNQASRRDRARKVYSENPIGRSLLTTETDNVVADGFRLQSKTGDKVFDKEAEQRYAEWAETADLRGMRCASEHERQVYRSPRRDGDGLVVLVDRGGESKCQYIPGDLICNPDEKINTPNIVAGVEVDDVARPTAFHVLDIDETGKREWTRIPARNAIYLAPVIDDDLSVRGDPCYSQVFDYLDGLDNYIDAVVIAARMAAVFGLIFKEESAAKNFSGLPTLPNSQGKEQRAITLENGMVKYIGTKDSVAQVQASQPMQQTPDFIRIMCRLAGLPFDQPLELVLKDMSQVNFASARIGLLGYYRACRARQRWFRTTYLDRRYNWWISREQKRQAVGLPGAFVSKFPENYWKHSFVSVGWDYTDPVSESQADLLQMDMGTKTPQMIAAERGRDYEEMQEDFAVARALRKLKQLPDLRSNLTRHPLLGIGANGDPNGWTVPEPAKPAVPNQ